jgi:hypothetical protein
VPIAMTSTRPGGAESAIHVDHEKGAAGLLQAVEACGALLVAMVTTASPGARAWHPHGTSDPEGFAAMGVAEILVHGHDAAQGLGVLWEPPADLCARVLSRLFPGAPADAAHGRHCCGPPAAATFLTGLGWATSGAGTPNPGRRRRRREKDARVLRALVKPHCRYPRRHGRLRARRRAAPTP